MGSNKIDLIHNNQKVHTQITTKVTKYNQITKTKLK